MRQTDRQEGAVWHAWCEHNGCDWEHEAEEKNDVLAQRVSSAAMAGHGLDTGHHETKHEKVGEQT